MTHGPLVVVGDTLLDRDIDGDAHRLAPDAPVPVVDVRDGRHRPGGAGLAAVLAVRDARDVVLVTALGTDPASRTARQELTAAGIRLVELPLHGSLPVKTRVRAAGRPLVRYDEGGGRPGGAPRAEVRAALAGARAVLVADYGRGVAGRLAAELTATARRVPVVWDPHPRGDTPVPGVRIATPNAAEALGFAGGDDGDTLRGHAARGARLAARWEAAAVAVTLGDRGALLTRAAGMSPMLVPAPEAVDGDPCGAGDCFATTAAAALADGALPEEAVQRAVAAATEWIAAGPATGRPAPSGTARPGQDAFALAEAVRSRGGTVVATGGCFDLLHAGHVGLLQSARRIGDCLVVCLNSDASVARLKGPGRPMTPQADRARVLTGLGCVDSVVVFDEDTPETLLRRLRPDVWVKGGDYTAETLPEAATLREWGGQSVVLPYLEGHSTTDLARRAARAWGQEAPS
ncbi:MULTISPECIES: D-glycero-beta-D-manno-heptose 1-phosphate adenylyltransferase [Streptomycetaceae]|uniref:D-glycero-beta-D-manno-heptose 1-phosphate adenylyltransferase n=1 Tax=Streptantibioticus cattleyicolor (strain ATCC 35852 / DSM 46488 / JCM 4925 / NBRC 14057 / NRRL 8057) TaxID=1003195 RepID=F8K2J9_STREN|nr:MULTISPECIES: D-glycero-beta-D-manno-heptose 1-phosphate adenylyltransferase [Streptomycetaceae]AEW97510.1 bifunctional synthase/transferase [Streptantibioticus cattleyicolor NRRL 8057 = DSM 46488]MYS61943.1 D-glycero-beta-D-manno-heptose 1-phosphate adenylyltransferase [Streptomyces sp. SID5468]CCB77834.1 Bifunctional protein hldE [Includes: D-beta-D-heptose 7-phosphate kinase; D-beta-D-heptose 1-phosphate adenosyltransferase] [Streptantibioticus cattleyicolor NRRL 8057 = DSM 46488]